MSSATVRDRLDRFVALLEAWQATHNLVSASTLDDLWTRHIEDSLQLLDHVPPEVRQWVDLGSGGGMPGLVCAIPWAGGERRMTLVESRGKKGAFLRQAARATETPVRVVTDRIEAFAAREPASADLVSARALAPLPTLFTLAAPLLKEGATLLLPKGEEADGEIDMATRDGWRFDVAAAPSRTAAGGVILKVTGLARDTRL